MHLMVGLLPRVVKSKFLLAIYASSAQLGCLSALAYRAVRALSPSGAFVAK